MNNICLSGMIDYTTAYVLFSYSAIKKYKCHPFGILTIKIIFLIYNSFSPSDLRKIHLIYNDLSPSDFHCALKIYLVSSYCPSTRTRLSLVIEPVFYLSIYLSSKPLICRDYSPSSFYCSLSLFV